MHKGKDAVPEKERSLLGSDNDYYRKGRHCVRFKDILTFIYIKYLIQQLLIVCPKI